MAGTKERKEQRLKLFVEHYLQHGEASSAARAAGYNGTPGSVGVRGSRLLKEARERGLLDKARDRVETKVQKTTEDWARKLWAQADANLGDDGVAEAQQSWKDDAGRFHLKRYKPQAALIALTPLYAPKEGASQQTQVNVFNNIPPELAAKLYKALMNGGNGNGARQ